MTFKTPIIYCTLLRMIPGNGDLISMVKIDMSQIGHLMWTCGLLAFFCVYLYKRSKAITFSTYYLKDAQLCPQCCSNANFINHITILWTGCSLVIYKLIYCTLFSKNMDNGDLLLDISNGTLDVDKWSCGRHLYESVHKITGCHIFSWFKNRMVRKVINPMQSQYVLFMKYVAKLWIWCSSLHSNFM